MINDEKRCNLATRWRAQLVKEWNYEKNFPLKPNMFSQGSSKKIWWSCGEGHDWRATIASRANEHGCPKCTGKIPTIENNLAVVCPELVREWYPSNNGELKPSDFTPRSGHKVWWRCSKGHDWIQTIHNRTRGSGCPECYAENRGVIFRKALIKKRGSLALNHPNLVKEWHPTKNGDLKPSDVLSRSDMKVWWKCEKGHEWLVRVSSRTGGPNRKGSGCPECYKQSRLKNT